MKTNADRDAKNALLNLLIFPGLGSLRSGHTLAGTGQIIFVLTGSVMLLIWLFKELSQYYGLMFGEVQTQNVGWVGEVGGILFGISWLWTAMTSLSLFRRASMTTPMPPPILSDGKMPLDPITIRGELAALPQWQRDDGSIARTFQFKDFPAAMKFVNAVAELAEQAQHHPDVDIRWNKVTLGLTTHDAGGLTEKDFALAKQFDAQSAN